jgi:hypothetical protein
MDAVSTICDLRFLPSGDDDAAAYAQGIVVEEVVSVDAG